MTHHFIREKGTKCNRGEVAVYVGLGTQRRNVALWDMEISGGEVEGPYVPKREKLTSCEIFLGCRTLLQGRRCKIGTSVPHWVTTTTTKQNLGMVFEISLARVHQ